LLLDGIELDYGNPEQAGDMIRKVVLGTVDELALAEWLCSLPSIKG